MNKQELETSIDLLDDIVEQLVEIDGGLGLIPGNVLENIQHVISYMEREIRDGCEESYTSYDEEEGWPQDDGT
mgnify:CR=1 FL=1